MKFWTDVNIPRPFKNALEQAGHEVFTAPERAKDTLILQQACDANAVIVTFDRDYYKYVLVDGWKCAGVIWIRPTPLNRRGEIIVKLVRLTMTHAERLSTSFITLSLDRIDVISLK
jgi:predicted nuclease of predicted toxin-antitoxin system